MDIEDKIKAIKEQLSILLDQFNKDYPEFLTNDDRINSFSNVFKSLDYLNDTLKKLYYRNKRSKN